VDGIARRLPKQFLPLVGNRSTYQEILLQVQDPMFTTPIVIRRPQAWLAERCENYRFSTRRVASMMRSCVASSR
jgi:hypothetical protein